MILYNMRYRGPIEHDKFTLNILQLHNEVIDMLDQEIMKLNSNDSLMAIKGNVDSIFETIIGKHNDDKLLAKIGLSESVFYKMLDYKE